MKRILVILAMSLSLPTMASFGFGSNKIASPTTVNKAFANPNLYVFDDGGNISFGNGIYRRRFNRRGQAQVCHSNNYLIAGQTQKCVSPVKDSEGKTIRCRKYQTVALKTKMTGSATICNDDDGDPFDPCQKPVTVKVNKGPRVKVAIYRKSGMKQDDPRAGFMGYTYLTIPRC